MRIRASGYIFCLLLITLNVSAQNLSAGYYHTMVICEDSTVWSSGANTYAQKGNTTDLASNQFVQAVENGINTTSGGNNIVMLKSDNSVTTWGYNKFGQSGVNAAVSVTEASQLIGLENIIQIESGENNTFALRNDGSLWTWGYNVSGQLGLGTKLNVSTPTKINIEGVTQVSASQSHTMALLKNGTVKSWGNNLYGALGVNPVIKTELSPVEVSTLANVVKVVAGTHYSLALKEDGSVWAWGFNEHGMLGQGHNNDVNEPSPVGGLNNVIDIVSGQSHVLALTAEGKVYAWGLNIYAQLGNGSYNNANLPVVLGLDNISMIAAGAYHSLATNELGELYTWGFNNTGQLGDNSTSNRSIPTKIDLPCTVKKIDVVCPTKAVANSSTLSICTGEDIEFTNTSENTTNHKWVIQNTEIEQDTTTQTFSEAGEYEIQLIANPDGCVDITSLFVTVHEVPNASFSLENQVCFSGEPISLIGNDTTGVWSGSGVNNNIFNPVTASVGSHNLFYTIDNGYCQTTDSNAIEVLADPVANFEIIMINDSTIELVNNSTDYNNIEWFFGDGSSSTELNPTHQYDTSGVFNVVQLVDNSCASDATQQQVTIAAKTTSISNMDVTQSGVEVSIFPNPAKDKVVISGQINEEGATINITNTLGQNMVEINQAQSPTGFVQQIDVSNYESGIYFVAVRVGDKQSITKLIVTK